MPLLTVDALRTSFHTRNGVVRAVDGVSFAIDAGETLGIVGESGSGKSVACYSLLGLLPTPPARIEGGSARFESTDLLQASRSRLRGIRGRSISMIFQDPMTALNPYMRIGDQVAEPLLAHAICSKAEARSRAVEALRAVGIPAPEDRFRSWPHEFSGGMRQRVGIAMALVTRPRLLIADEPTTALDVTVQAQILDLIRRMQHAAGDGARPPMAVLLVTHNLGIVAGLCDRVLVMYAGRILESAAVRDLFHHPLHPYTHALLRAIPSAVQTRSTLYSIPGDPPDPTVPLPGCPFAPRCDHVRDACRVPRPDLLEQTPGHATACLRVQAEGDAFLNRPEED